MYIKRIGEWLGLIQPSPLAPPGEPQPIRLCIDCVHHRAVNYHPYPDTWHMCDRCRISVVDLIDGSEKFDGELYCHIQRAFVIDDCCGPNAIHFKEKSTISVCTK